MRTWNVIGVNATRRTEIVLGGFRVELIECDRFRRREEVKLFRLNDQMQKPLLRADRAVAVYNLREIRGHRKSHSTTMTTALVCWHMTRSLRSLYSS